MGHMEVGERQADPLRKRREDYTEHFGPRKAGGLGNVMYKLIAFGGRDIDDYVFLSPNFLSFHIGAN